MDVRKTNAAEVMGIAKAIKCQAEQLGRSARDLGVYADDNDAELKAKQIYNLADIVVKQMDTIIN